MPRTRAGLSGGLDGLVALVTGAGQGIGRAVAQRLARDGATVAVVDRVPANETVDLIQAAGGHAASFIADISDPDQVRTVIADIARELGPVDILINNAGVYPAYPLDDVTLEQWRAVFAVNVEGPLLLTQAVVTGMRENGWGRIVNVSSNSIALQVPDNAHYIASKMAVIGLTRAAATQYATDGITVNAVAPSLVRTPGSSVAPPEVFQQLAQQQAIKRTQEPEDLADTIALLVSEDARFITGQTVYADGGLIRS